MTELHASMRSRIHRSIEALSATGTWVLVALLGLVVAAELVFFAVHASHVLGYPYPLDYGEGPLLAQVNLLRGGIPIWRLYTDPDAPPYTVVNYPPVYHLAATLIALPLGDALLAGRLVSLVATAGVLVALWQLSAGHRSDGARSGLPFVARGLIVLAFLGLPIAREWAVLMRVDLLGVCLGLWGMLLVRHGGRRALWAALPLTLSLFAKPSLVAAPAAALIWLFFRDWRRALGLGILLAAGGGGLFALLQVASGGWFAIHVLGANSNPWERRLAANFWHDQLLILWPLLAAGAAGFLASIGRGGQRMERMEAEGRRGAADTARRGGQRMERRGAAEETGDRRPESRYPSSFILHPSSFILHPSSFILHPSSLLPLVYTLIGAIGAFGVGKVGAYANYFLEFYAGLVWLAAAGVYAAMEGRASTTRGTEQREQHDLLIVTPRSRLASPRSRLPARVSRLLSRVSSLVSPGSLFSVRCSLFAMLFMIGALLRYYPTWSETYLKLAGIIEKRNPPRIAFGRYGVWQDLRREREILETLSRVNAALVDEVRAAGNPIFTDVPGVAAQAGQLARHQAFEHRQLYDAGLADQRPLLRDLANGRAPLVVLDYLGNWLTPEMIALITHRYAQDGSRGTYDLYRPVDPGPYTPAEIAFPGGLWLLGYHLAPSPGRPAYHEGEIVPLTLVWRATPGASNEAPFEVAVQLTDDQGYPLWEEARPLLYGALPPSSWDNEAMQHMHPIELPPGLPPGEYGLALTLRQEGRERGPARPFARIAVEEQGGMLVGDIGASRPYVVSGPLLEAWERTGGYEGYGDPLMPSVPFQGYTLQCFTRACLRLEGDQARQLPLGEVIHLGDAGLRQAPQPAGEAQHFAKTGQTLSGTFLAFWRASGGEAALGPPITPELIRGELIVQYTRYARLERPKDGGAGRLGPLGVEYLRLPGGTPYRWP